MVMQTHYVIKWDTRLTKVISYSLVYLSCPANEKGFTESNLIKSVKSDLNMFSQQLQVVNCTQIP